MLPAISSNPSTGFSIGVGLNAAFKREEPSALYSQLNGNLSFTTKKQLIAQLKNNIYLKGNKVFLSGDWRFLLFSQDTYGLSTAAPQGGSPKYNFVLNGQNVDDDSLVQPMRFNQVRFHQTASWLIQNSFFVGLGYHLDYYYKIKDEKLDTAARKYTAHYAYSRFYKYDINKYIVSGVSLNLLWDTRDNLVNAYKGHYANINVRFNPTFLGSTRSSTSIYTEWRSFHSVSKKNPRNLIAFWFLGNFTPAGDLPYLTLPALGYDQRGRGGRGYTQGRYRGPDMLYAESEFRFSLTPCTDLLGAVIFLNATTANNPEKTVRLFDYVQPGYGFGFRVKADKKSKTNLQVDFGFGNKSSGVYFGATETF